MDVDIEQLKQTVEGMHGCKGKLIETAPVSETFQCQPVRQGIVHVFEITGHPTATRCYAWFSPVEGSDKRRFFAVLHIPPMTSARDAVSTAIVQEFRTHNPFS